MQHLEHIHGGDIYRASEKYGLAKDKIIDFSANINPLGPSQGVVNAVVKNLGLIASYPDPECKELRKELAAYLGIPMSHLLVGNGTAELIYLLVRASGKNRALIPVPTFSEYGLSVLSQGGNITEIAMREEKGFALPVSEILEKLPGADLLFLCNPNNPTGRLAGKKAMQVIIDEALLHGVLVVVDEAFMDFVPDKSRYTVMPLVSERPNLAVLYSMTKFFGIPGLRLGAVAAPEELVMKMNALRHPWSVNILAQVAGVAGLREKGYMEQTNRLVQEEKRFLYRELSALPGLRPLPGAANFLLVDVSCSGLTSGELADMLGKRGIMVRDCRGFAGLEGRYIRLAVRTRPENEALLRVLRLILEVKGE